MPYSPVVVLSAKGGVGKTTTTALLAMAAARSGLNVTAVDLDPRATLTKVLGAQHEPGYSVDAILAAEDDPAGWGKQLRVPSSWHERLHVLPAERGLGNREKGSPDHAERRLAAALEGMPGDLVIVDTPPRPGGILLLSALALPDAAVLYSTTLDQDGLDGIAEAWTAVDTARRYSNPTLTTLGITVTRAELRHVDAQRCRDELWSIYGTNTVLMPMLPERVIVREARAANDWTGHYPAAGAEIAGLTEMLWQHIADRLTWRGRRR